jgi:uncharacterized membrane protein YhaH (DUF805 family)
MTILAKLTSFGGRIRRRDYLVFSLALILLGNGVGYTLIHLAGGVIPGPGHAATVRQVEIALGINVVIQLLLLWPGAALGVKRLHDHGLPGLWMRVYYVPKFLQQALNVQQAVANPGNFFPSGIVLYSVILYVAVGLGFFVLLGCLDGAPGPNRYGDSPKGLS